MTLEGRDPALLRKKSSCAPIFGEKGGQRDGYVAPRSAGRFSATIIHTQGLLRAKAPSGTSAAKESSTGQGKRRSCVKDREVEMKAIPRGA
jgi:hypothetical protein